jgi:hypothetical protein
MFVKKKKLNYDFLLLTIKKKVSIIYRPGSWGLQTAQWSWASPRYGPHIKIYNPVKNNKYI